MSNQLRLAFRNLKKRSFYTTLNVFGLSLGIACSIVLFQFISYHLQFDRHYQHTDQLYRVVTDIHLEDGSVISDKGAPMALGNAIRAEIPQVSNQAFLFENYREHVFTVDIRESTGIRGKRFSEHGNVAFADRHWFELFEQVWLAGNPGASLEQPNSAVINNKLAQKYFGDANPIGKSISIDGKGEFKITGLLKTPGKNTDMKTELFLSMPSFKTFYPDMYEAVETEWAWFNTSNSLFLLLPERVSPQTINQEIAKLAKEHMSEMAKYYDFHLVALKDLHFDARHDGMVSRTLLTTLAIVGFFIILIACVNFVNLATAQNASRAKEVSTRKILGGSAREIFGQLIFETSCIVLLAMMLSFVWVYFTLPILNQWLNIQLSINLFSDRQLMIALVCLGSFIIAAAGVYPSLLLSRFKPVTVLKSKSISGSRPWLRKSLILLQNTVAQSLIICTLIIMLQNKFLKSADLGFNKDAILMVPLPKNDKTNSEFLRNRLLRLNAIKDVSLCFRPPASETFKGGSVKFDQRDWEKYNGVGILGDSHYLGTFGLKLIAGRNLSESDTVHEFVVSENMIRKLGFTEASQVIGHQFVAGALDDRSGIIIGVVKDIHLHPLYRATEPLFITTQRADYAYVGIKMAANGNPEKTISEVKEIWQSVNPETNFEYHFLDQQIDEFYKSEVLLNKLIGSFAIIAIIISCLGLLGLISLLTIQRTKEIGIRKIIGASVINIALLLSKDFAILVGLALLLASGFAWILMSEWLQGFAYRIEIPFWIFLIAGTANMLLALSTICYHAIKAAMVNPVNSLRSE